MLNENQAKNYKLLRRSFLLLAFVSVAAGLALVVLLEFLDMASSLVWVYIGIMGPALALFWFGNLRKLKRDS